MWVFDEVHTQKSAIASFLFMTILWPWKCLLVQQQCIAHLNNPFPRGSTKQAYLHMLQPSTEQENHCH